MKVREAGRIVSVAVTVAVAVNDQGRREVLGMAIGASEAETFWTDFLRSLARRGLRGVKPVIADDHKGLKAATTRVLGATRFLNRHRFVNPQRGCTPTKISSNSRTSPGVSSVTTYRQGTPASLAVMVLAVGAGIRAPSASRPRWRYRGRAG